MKRRNFISLMAVLAAAGALSACGSSSSAAGASGAASTAASGEAADRLEAARQRGTLIVALEGAWSPWCYHDDTDTLVGYDVEVSRAIAEHLGSDAAPLMVIPVDISPDRTFQDICSWLEQCPALPEAIVAENDEVAAAAIRALRSRGCAVPDEVAVMGFDDIPICEMVDPAITTVHTHKEQLGSEAVSLLYRRIVAGETAQSIRSHGCIKLALSTRIVVRGSTTSLERR